MFCLQAATINSVTAIDPYVISQYVNNFARGMQEENNNRLVAGDHLATYLATIKKSFRFMKTVVTCKHFAAYGKWVNR